LVGNPHQLAADEIADLRSECGQFSSEEAQRNEGLDGGWTARRARLCRADDARRVLR
jgi:hypothetical protein